jgi:hypothetical protein
MLTIEFNQQQLRQIAASGFMVLAFLTSTPRLEAQQFTPSQDGVAAVSQWSAGPDDNRGIQPAGVAHASYLPRTVNSFLSPPPPAWTASSLSQSVEPNFEDFFVGEGPSITVLPSLSWLDYGPESIKAHGDAKGVYASTNYGVRLFEVSYDRTEITFRSGFELKQNDYTFKYTDYWTEGVGYSIGGHFIQSNDATTDIVTTIITGLKWYELDKWNADLDVFISRYEQFRPDLTVLQLSGRYGKYWTKRSDYTVRTEVAGHFINTSEDVVGTRNLFSGELHLSVDSGRMGMSVFGWGGRQVFPVRNGGFIIFNLGDKRLGGYGGELRTKLTRNAVVTARVSNEHVRDVVSDQFTNQLVASLLFSFTF